ncbi:3369_t:CDS:2 [Scutellospora calospora]|uniref:3369_t:CDS:1 n=1 Tax=Scutellospora calospora TaxID=85575 RepID=A0ACA9JVP0_9GLOM|nr:3369_t:CDS:2 [Scutellospora calospora]
MIAAGRELQQSLTNHELVHQRCAAHILNIAVQHGLQLVSSVITKVQDFVIKIRNSTKFSDSLKKIYKQENIAELKPDLDVETSDVRLTITSLLRHLDLFIQTHTNLDECMVAESINFKLQEYWECVNDSTTIGTLLDPRSKTKTFIDIKQYENATRKNKRSFFESLISEQDSEQVSVEDEIVQYLSLPVDSTTNPLDWWRHFSKDFPTLAKMASCYLSIQGSSVLSEQAFSVAANTITKIRYNLKPDTACAAMCLKS